jgi:hypothetical protein
MVNTKNIRRTERMVRPMKRIEEAIELTTQDLLVRNASFSCSVEGSITQDVERILHNQGVFYYKNWVYCHDRSLNEYWVAGYSLKYLGYEVVLSDQALELFNGIGAVVTTSRGYNTIVENVDPTIVETEEIDMLGGSFVETVYLVWDNTRYVEMALPTQKNNDEYEAFIGAAKKVFGEEPTVTNDLGGKQSKIYGDYTQLPYHAMRTIAQVMEVGAAKYSKNNWKLIPESDHINHALHHLIRYANDGLDEDLNNALTRLCFAVHVKEENL